jgi:DnaJ-class molecular chaperone
MKKSAYDILGVPEGAPFTEVRAAYFRLARKHHPDKLGHLTPEERKHHEAVFQEVTAAYDAIERGEGTMGGEEAAAPERDWREVWGRVESLFQRPEVWDCMKRVFESTVRARADGGSSGGADRLIHTVYVPITLEELHAGKAKKLQLVLKGIAEPVMCRISCADYPKAVVRVAGADEEETHIVNAHMALREHPVFRFDDLFDKWDLHMTTEVTWADYVRGKEVCVPSLGGGSPLVVPVPPFPRMELPIVVPGRGVAGRGDLYIALEWRPPTRECWEGLARECQEGFMSAASTLDALSA